MNLIKDYFPWGVSCGSSDSGAVICGFIQVVQESVASSILEMLLNLLILLRDILLCQIKKLLANSFSHKKQSHLLCFRRRKILCCPWLEGLRGRGWSGFALRHPAVCLTHSGTPDTCWTKGYVFKMWNVDATSRQNKLYWLRTAKKLKNWMTDGDRILQDF